MADLVEVDDGPVDVLAIDRCREGFVQRVQVVHFDPVGVVFILADQLANRRVATFHEFNQQPGRVADVLALFGEQGEEIGHFREDAIEHPPEDRWLDFFAHGVAPRKRWTSA